jgi:hypothetical protein
MTFSPLVRPAAPPPFVGPHSSNGYYGELMDNSATSASSAYPSANRAYYYPLIISQPCVAFRFFWLNGATVSGTNSVQVGLYRDNDAGDDGPGTSIVLGTATTQATINVCQFDNITDTAISAGRIWLAIWCNNTTSTFFRHAPSGSLARITSGYAQDSLTTGLPSTATPVSVAPYIAVCGFTTISAP